MLFGEGEAMAFVQSYDQNTGLGGLDDRSLRQGLGCSCVELAGSERQILSTYLWHSRWSG